MDEVWLASDFAIEVFAAAGVERARLFKIPLSLDVERSENSVHSSEREHVDGFCFLSVLHWGPSSGWEPLVQAYLEEFREEEYVRMVLNFLGVPEDSKDDVSEGIRKFMIEDLGISSATPRLDVCLRPVSPDLYRSAHIYMLPHHAEGSESHCMEAMASGLPVIATGCGGHKEFMSPENSWVIDFTLKKVPASVAADKPSLEDANWAEPSVVKLKAAMRSACDSPEAVRQKGRAARKTICDGFSREVAGRLAKARLESLLKRSATRTQRAEDGPPHRSANTIENTIIKDPLELLQANRSDVMAKYLYASFRERRIRSTFALHLYAEHLRLWNGFQEYDNPSKCDLRSYLENFHDLLDSIKAHGCDSDVSVLPVTPQGKLLNGGHRLAACLLHSRQVPCRMSHDPLDGQEDCSFQFFKQIGLTERWTDAMALQYARLRRNTFVVTLFPSAVGKDNEIEAVIQEFGPVVYMKQERLINNGPMNLIRLMYDREPWFGSWQDDFSGGRQKLNLCFTNPSNSLRVYLVEFDSANVANACKDRIRDLFGIGDDSVHINDTHEETLRLVEALFNQNSIHHLNNAVPAQLPRYEEALATLKLSVATRGLSIADFCVTGSAVLSAYGLREVNQIGVIHSVSDQVFGDHPLICSHDSDSRYYRTDKDDILFNPDNHFFVDGVKFVSLGLFRTLLESREENDRADLARLNSIEGTMDDTQS
jgi:hypothetical protein